MLIFLLGGNPEGIAREKLMRAGHEDITLIEPEIWEKALEESKAEAAKD